MKYVIFGVAFGFVFASCAGYRNTYKAPPVKEPSEEDKLKMYGDPVDRSYPRATPMKEEK